MSLVRVRVSAVALIAVIVSAQAGLCFAADHHAICPVMQHDCDKAARLTQCCFGEQRDGSNPSGPAASRVQLTAGSTFISLAPLQTVVAPAVQPGARVHTSPTRGTPPDLPTLFATLLI